MNLNELFLSKPEPTGNTKQTIVLLSTAMYQKGNKLVYSKELSLLKRKSNEWLEWDYITQDIEDLDLITNLFTVNDGIYQIVMTNAWKDYETGVIDNWDYKLIPYKGE